MPEQLKTQLSPKAEAPCHEVDLGSQKPFREANTVEREVDAAVDETDLDGSRKAGFFLPTTGNHRQCRNSSQPVDKSRPRTKDLAHGRWRGILAELGINAQCLSGKHSPCPLCGGKDRFRFINVNGDGRWICSKCGAHDAFELLKLFHGWDYKEAARRVEAVVGAAPTEKAKAVTTDRDKRTAMNQLWTSGKRITLDDPAGQYLHRRCALSTFPPCLRYVASARYQGDHVTWHPVMVAMVVAPDGSPCILHRTYLTKDGRKADVEAPRRLMPGMVVRGSAVRLAEHEDELGIAEGIETAFSAHALTGIPCWAALNAGLLAQWIPPKGVKRIVVFADHDRTFTGLAAAYALAKRLQSDEVDVQVRAPEKVGTDWNDAHQAGPYRELGASA